MNGENTNGNAGLALENYAPGAVPGWAHTSNGHHVFANPALGVLEIGSVPGASYDQPLYHEHGGGGSLVVGYTFKKNLIQRLFGRRGRLMVMMLIADRFNLQGDYVDIELPGGFVDQGETHLKAALRELIEETGQQVADAKRVPGRGYVGNRTFFRLANEEEGTAVYMFPLTRGQVAAVEASDNLILASWEDAINDTRDALSGMAIGRVASILLRR